LDPCADCVLASCTLQRPVASAKSYHRPSAGKPVSSHQSYVRVGHASSSVEAVCCVGLTLRNLTVVSSYQSWLVVHRGVVSPYVAVYVCTMCQGLASVHERHHRHHPGLAVSADTAGVRMGSVLRRDTMFAGYSVGRQLTSCEILSMTVTTGCCAWRVIS